MEILYTLWFWICMMAVLSLFIAIVMFEFGFRKDEQMTIASWAILAFSFILFIVFVLLYLLERWYSRIAMEHLKI